MKISLRRAALWVTLICGIVLLGTCSLHIMSTQTQRAIQDHERRLENERQAREAEQRRLEAEANRR
jgi:Tfp pilus assembly protein PilW